MHHVGEESSRSVGALARASSGTATRARAPRVFVAPLWNRIVDVLQIRGETAGLAIAVALIAFVLLREAWLARLQVALAEQRDLFVAVVEALLCGYLVAARVAAAREAQAVLAAVDGALDLSEARQTRLRETIGRYRRASLVAAGAAGAVLGALATLLIRDATIHPWTLADWTPEFAWRRSLTPVVGWLLGTYVYVTIVEAERTSNLARHLKSIDLFEADMLAPFTWFGLRTALAAVGLLSLFALLLTEHGFGLLVGALAGVAALAAAAGLLFPLRGLRDRISEEKTRELACCREALRRARDALVEGRPIPSGHGLMADIVAYRQLVESVNEWPVDTPTVLRAAAYVLLPIAFWLSGSIGPETLVRVAEILAA